MMGFKRKHKGSITIELSIIFPIFCIIAMTFVFYMHGMVLQMGMEAAAREGGREMSLSHYDVYAEARAQEVLNYFKIDKTSIVVKNFEDQQGVIIERPYVIYIPFVGRQEYQLRRMFVFYPESVED